MTKGRLAKNAGSGPEKKSKTASPKQTSGEVADVSSPSFNFFQDKTVILISAGLFVLVLAVFFPALRNGFLSWYGDDPLYVTENPHVNSGLTRANIHWAFTSMERSNWHPLTWISHMLDCQWYGLKPCGHHLTSLLFHALNVVLLFVVLQRMTGAMGRSFIVAILFGLHPLRSE